MFRCERECLAADPIFSELLKMSKLIGIANRPYVHNVLLRYGHRHHREEMTIHSHQDGWLPIDLGDLRGEPRLNIPLRNSDHKPRDSRWSMQGTSGCSSDFASTIGPQRDIRGQELRQSIEIAFFDRFQELLLPFLGFEKETGELWDL